MHIRYDHLPMHRPASADGASPVTDSPALFERREIDPSAPTIQRREGSLRQATTGTAAGIQSISQGYVASNVPIDMSGDVSMGFMLHTGNVANEGSFTLLSLGDSASSGAVNLFHIRLFRSAGLKIILDVRNLVE